MSAVIEYRYDRRGMTNGWNRVLDKTKVRMISPGAPSARPDPYLAEHGPEKDDPKLIWINVPVPFATENEPDRLTKEEETVLGELIQNHSQDADAEFQRLFPHFKIMAEPR